VERTGLTETQSQRQGPGVLHQMRIVEDLA
jgi:hypothetical protein